MKDLSFSLRLDPFRVPRRLSASLLESCNIIEPG